MVHESIPSVTLPVYMRSFSGITACLVPGVANVSEYTVINLSSLYHAMRCIISLNIIIILESTRWVSCFLWIVRMFLLKSSVYGIVGGCCFAAALPKHQILILKQKETGLLPASLCSQFAMTMVKLFYIRQHFRAPGCSSEKRAKAAPS